MKSSTLSLVQWDFTSFLLGGLLQRLSIQNACAFSSWPAVPFSGGGDQMTTGWTVIWFLQNLACPQLVAIQCFFFLWWLNWWFFMADFDIQPSREKCFPHPILFHVVLPAMAPYPLWSPWLQGCWRAVIFLARKKTCISVYHYITSDICICIYICI